MKINLSFKDYLDAKERLKLAGESCPRTKKLYEVRKYCKLPLLESIHEDEKHYITLKPKDKIEILWEYESIENPSPKQITLTFDEDQIMYFAWSEAKIKKWINSSATLL